MMDHPGKLGVWTWVDGFSAGEAAEFAQQLETWGQPVEVTLTGARRGMIQCLC